jgi:hypothetical protein|tara:strand:- start:256 stop:438 length:183 start_codon:yes stop_codon:yes gene_type:complete
MQENEAHGERKGVERFAKKEYIVQHRELVREVAEYDKSFGIYYLGLILVTAVSLYILYGV